MNGGKWERRGWLGWRCTAPGLRWASAGDGAVGLHPAGEGVSV